MIQNYKKTKQSARNDYQEMLGRHFYLVKKYCEMAGIANRGDKHDNSKLSVDEFDAYAFRYYLDEENEEYLKNFEDAWIHHYKNNDHHWEYWLNEQNKPNRMLRSSNIEMICDWLGAGEAYSEVSDPKEPLKYYEEHKHEMILHPFTRKFTEEALSGISEFGYDYLKNLIDLYDEMFANYRKEMRS